MPPSGSDVSPVGEPSGPQPRAREIFDGKAKAATLYAAPHEARRVGREALLVARVAAEQVVDREAFLRAMLDDGCVAHVARSKMAIGLRAEPRLIEQHAA